MKKNFRIPFNWLLIAVIAFCADGMAAQQINIDEGRLKVLTLQKTEDLRHFITTIANKEVDKALRALAVKGAIDLFISDKNSVEVSSLNSAGIRRHRIREYLNALMSLPYRRVDISWFDINVVTDFKKGEDGSLYATVRIYQKFEAYDLEGKMVYKDITTKDISVKVTRIEVVSDDGMKEILQVFLGDIKVVETR